MYTVIPEKKRERMSETQIREAYDGKWLFMVHVGLDPFIAMPVIVADDWWEGREEGIYEAFKNDTSYGATMHLSLLKRRDDMMGQY